ncbi:MAG: murein biosynthesis integral membrane protein MurJ [Phycisphaerales bacterium]
MAGDAPRGGRFESHARLVSGLTLLSRATGLVRDSVLARVFGASPLTDAFLFAFMIPHLFRRLFGEGALAAAFLPVFSRVRETDPAAARRLGRRVMIGMVVVVAAMVLLLEVGLVAAAMLGRGSLAGSLAMVLLPYAPMVCAVAILGAMLQVHGRFTPAAAAPLLLNGMMIAALLLPAARFGWTPDVHITVVAASVLVAGGLQIVWAWSALRAAWRADPLDATSNVASETAPDAAADTAADPASDPASDVTSDKAAAPSVERQAVRDVLRQAAPMVLGLSVLQLSTLADGLIAGWPSVVGPTVAGHPYPLEPGALTAVSIAQRLYQFPLGVFGIAIATAVFPLLARTAFRQGLVRGGHGGSSPTTSPAASPTTSPVTSPVTSPGASSATSPAPSADAPSPAAPPADQSSFIEVVRRGLRLVAFIGFPATAGLILVREPLVRALFVGGAFTVDDAQRTARVLVPYAAAVWAYSAVHVLTRGFYALERPRTPVRVAIGVLGLNVVGNLVLIWTPLREAGLALSTAIASVVQCVVLLMLLGRIAAPESPGTGILDRPTVGSFARSLVATAAMVGMVLAVDAILRAAGGLGGLGGSTVARLAALVLTGGVGFALAARVLRCPELNLLLRRGAD